MSKKGIFISLALIATAWFVVERASATESVGQRCLHRICFVEQKLIGLESVPLLGSSRFRYLVFDVYTAALYGPQDWRQSRTFRPDSSSELVVEYHRSFSASELGEAADEILSKQHSAIPDSVRADISRFHRAYRNVRAGERYRLQYRPDVGTTLFLNNEALITIAGPEFATHYFDVWLHPRQPLDRTLRDELFGAA